MKNNVYVRSRRSIKNISLLRITMLIPLMIYGIYKNGVLLYMNKYTNIIGMFKPLILILAGAFIGALVNIIYEYIIKRNKESIIDALFSSFHIEYGILLACITTINCNVYLFSAITFVMLFISKFTRKRINTLAVIFIVMYFAELYLFKEYSFLNNYETAKVFSLDFMDYMVGRGAGGIAATHIILIIVSMIGISITSNNKTNITMLAIITSIILFGIYSIVSRIPFESLLLSNNIIFAYTYIATEYLSSSYTYNGEIIFGILVGVLTFVFYFVNPILAPFIAIAIVSLFNNLIDRIANRLNNKNIV